MNAIRYAGIGAVLFVLLVAEAQAQTSDDIQQGKRLFEGLCARCHGYDGTGGEGPNLNKPTLSRAPDDDSLRGLIRNGIPSRGMPRSRTLSPNEMGQLAAYVRSLGRTAPAAHTGNAERGNQIYEKLGCSSCHIINGQGSSLGPELSQIGARRAPEYLRQALLDPGGALPRGMLTVPGRGFDEFLLVNVVTRDGREVRGVRVNEDTFTLQIRDANNQFRSFMKSDLQRIEKEKGQSLIPAFKDRLSGTDLDDLVGYLLSLSGGK